MHPVCCIEVACDVDNPLVGTRGAARVYGPQKGATLDMVRTLDANLTHLAEVIERDINGDVSQLPGAGAAGGLGAGLVAFAGARLRPGVEIVIEAVDLARKLHGADLVFTGEGKLDEQTAYGKLVAGVAKLAKGAHVPCVALAGQIGEGAGELLKVGLTEYHCIADRPMSREESYARCAELLAETAQRVVRSFLHGGFRIGS